MHSKVKLSKREIKEDKFTTFMLTAKDQISDSWQYLVIGAVVIVLAIAGVIFFFSNRSSQANEAAEKLARAISDYHSNNTQVALLSFSQIATDYSGEPADEATYMLGKVNLESMNYAEARKGFEGYLGRSTGNKLKRAAAMAGLAACFEGEAKYAEAAAKYQDALSEYPTGPQDEEFQLGAFRNYLAANDIEKAKAQLAKLKETHKGSGKVYRAEMMLFEHTSSAR